LVVFQQKSESSHCKDPRSKQHASSYGKELAASLNELNRIHKHRFHKVKGTLVLRREGRDEDAARELTQEFFARVLSGAGVSPARARLPILPSPSGARCPWWHRDTLRPAGAGTLGTRISINILPLRGWTRDVILAPISPDRRGLSKRSITVETSPL
jgi:hypothetical protein